MLLGSKAKSGERKQEKGRDLAPNAGESKRLNPKRQSPPTESGSRLARCGVPFQNGRDELGRDVARLQLNLSRWQQHFQTYNLQSDSSCRSLTLSLPRTAREGATSPETSRRSRCCAVETTRLWTARCGLAGVAARVAYLEKCGETPDRIASLPVTAQAHSLGRGIGDGVRTAGRPVSSSPSRLSRIMQGRKH